MNLKILVFKTRQKSISELEYRMVDGKHFITCPSWEEVYEVDFNSCQVLEKHKIPKFKFFDVIGAEEDTSDVCDDACDQICITDYKKGLSAKCECEFGSYMKDGTCAKYSTDQVAFFVDDGVEIYSKDSADDSYLKWDQHMSFGSIKPDFFAWVDANDEIQVVLSTIGRNDDNYLSIRSLSNFASSR